MGLSDPIARRIVLAAPSTAGSQSGAQSPGAVGHYANQVNANTSPAAGSGPRQRLRQAPSSRPGRARGKKPSRVAS